jgi:hypothetical protein
MSDPQTTLAAFVHESNAIEGIMRDPTANEIEATRLFLQEGTLQLSMLKGLVKVYQPDAVIRDREGLDVRVGNHIPPNGSPKIPVYVERMFSSINGNFGYTPYQGHQDYEPCILSLMAMVDPVERSGHGI